MWPPTFCTMKKKESNFKFLKNDWKFEITCAWNCHGKLNLDMGNTKMLSKQHKWHIFAKSDQKSSLSNFL